MSKVTPIQNQLMIQVHYLNELNELNAFDIVENASLKMQFGCPWMQMHSLYIDHQCLV